MRGQNQQVDESTIAKGVSVIRAAGRPKKSIKVPEKRKLRVAAYCRVSKDIVQQEGSLETQMESFDRLISQHPEWELVEIYSDKGKTGTSTKNRAAFQKMKQDAQNGKIDKILVKSISRFCRNTVDMLSTVRELRDLGVGVVFEKENLDTTSVESELLLTVYAAFAQEESLSISENMRGGIRQRFKLGIPKVSQVYGYDNLERGVLSVNEEKAAVVRKIYQMYLDGAATTEIADALNELNVPPPIESSDMWYPTSVKCILRNEKYAGDSLMQKYYTANHLEHDSTPNKDLAVTQYFKEDTHPAIVPRDVYQDANLVLMMRDMKRGGNTYPYYGRLLCPHCGKPMVKVKIGRGKNPSCWICGGDGEAGTYEERTKCPLDWVKEPYLSNTVVDAIMSLDAQDLDEGDAENVTWVREQLEKKPSVEFSYLKRLVDHITFDGWDALKVVWVWGDESIVPYTVDRVSDYPDQTITEVDGEQYIGPFRVRGHRLENVIASDEISRQILLGIQIIPDNNQRFSGPPMVVRGE